MVTWKEDYMIAATKEYSSGGGKYSENGHTISLLVALAMLSHFP